MIGDPGTGGLPGSAHGVDTVRSPGHPIIWAQYTMSSASSKVPESAHYGSSEMLVLLDGQEQSVNRSEATESEIDEGMMG